MEFVSKDVGKNIHEEALDFDKQSKVSKP